MCQRERYKLCHLCLHQASYLIGCHYDSFLLGHFLYLWSNACIFSDLLQVSFVHIVYNFKMKSNVIIRLNKVRYCQ